MSLHLPANSHNRHYPSLRNVWGFFQHELILVSWGMMEVALLTPVMLSVLDWASFWPAGQAALWLMLILLLSFNLTRLMGLLWLPPATQRNITTLVLLFMLIVALPTLLYRPQSLFDLSWLVQFYDNLLADGRSFWTRDLSVLLLIIFMWWRGIRLAHQEFGIQRAGLRLRVGSLIIAPLVIWSSSRLSWSTTPFMQLFFLAALVSVALIRAEQIEQDHSGRTVSLRPRWLLVIFVASLATVFVAGVLAAVVGGDTISLVASWLSPLWLALRLSLVTVGSTVAFLAQPLFALFTLVITWLSEWLGKLFRAAFPEGLELPVIELPTPEATADIVVDTVETSFDGSKVITLLLLLALVLIVALSLSRLYRQSSLAALAGGSQGLDRPKAEKKGGLRQRLLGQLGSWRHWRTAASIRRIYREMSQAAEASGYPRAISETPYEYQETLNKVWPLNRADSILITQAYVRIRYGELPETKAELDEILAAWRRLESSQPATVSVPPATLSKPAK